MILYGPGSILILFESISLGGEMLKKSPLLSTTLIPQHGSIHGNSVVPLPFGGQNSTVLYGPGNNLAPFESVSLGGVVE
jgi:hypothetical protein